MVTELFKKLQDWRWYDEPNMLVVWVHLLAGASRGNGSLLTSVARLSLETGLTEKQVRLCLDKLARNGYITRKRADKRADITICDYDSYVGSCRESGQEKGEQRASEKNVPLNPPSSSSPTPPSSLPPISPKEEKKTTVVVEEKNRKRFVKPTIDEIRAYCLERRNGIDAEKFFDHYESKGWVVGKSPMKDWKAAVRTWENTQKGIPRQPQPTRHEKILDAKDIQELMYGKTK